MSQPYQFQPQHSGLTRLSVNEVAAQRTAIGALGVPNNLSDLSSAAAARANLGLGTLATQSGHPGFISGNWYHFSDDFDVSTGTALTQNAIRFQPFITRQTVVVNSLGTRITTTGGNVQLAIYGHSASTGRPTGNALCSTGSLSAGTVGVISGVNTQGNVTLAPGTYWMAVNADSAPVCQTQTPLTNSRLAHLVGNASQSSISSAAGAIGYSIAIAQTFGTWPNLTGATFAESVSSSQVNATALIHFKHA